MLTSDMRDHVPQKHSLGIAFTPSEGAWRLTMLEPTSGQAYIIAIVVVTIAISTPEPLWRQRSKVNA